ncbi:MAG TPA: GNAT family N-acetyltransferase, partial [Pirellulales bacterium]|nr:GNAT family N-acetyltransferase [Pirellulales bacterium]
MVASSDSPQLRPMSAADKSEVAELIYCSLNHWHQMHGRPPVFRGGPGLTEVFFDVYNELNPGCNVVAVSPENGRLMGACFYHPREHHVSLGVMAVHPNYFCQGVARSLVTHIVDYADAHGYKSVRLTQSALNVESFS